VLEYPFISCATPGIYGTDVAPETCSLRKTRRCVMTSFQVGNQVPVKNTEDQMLRQVKNSAILHDTSTLC
jgi:hypothetical protein